jgi:hypothetical protein
VIDKLTAFLRGAASGFRFVALGKQVEVGPIQNHGDHLAFPMIVGEKGFLVTVSEFDPAEILRESGRR